MATHNQDNLPKTPQEIQAYQEIEDYLKSLKIGLNYADQKSELEIKAEATFTPKPELQTPQEIKSFRKRVIGTPEEFITVLQEVFGRTVYGVYEKLLLDAQNNKKLIKGNTDAANLLRQISNIGDDDKTFGIITEEQIEKLNKMLLENDILETPHFTPQVAVQLKRAIDRTKFIYTKRELFENREQIEKDVEHAEQELQISHAEAFRANREKQRLEENRLIIEQRLSEADQNLEIILAEVEQAEKALANLKAQEARTPKVRETDLDQSSIIIPETVEQTPTIKVVSKPMAVKCIAVEILVEPLDADLDKERIVAEQEAEYQKLVAEKNTKLEQEKTERDNIISGFINRIRNYKKTRQDIDRLTSAKEEIELFEKNPEHYDYNLMQNTKFFLGKEIKISNQQLLLILPRVKNIIIDKLNALKSKVKPSVEELDVNYETIGNIQFAPCFEVSSKVRKILQENSPSLSSDIERIKGFIKTVNEFYRLQPDIEKLRIYDRFLLGVINDNNISGMESGDRHKFINQFEEFGFDKSWWQTESGGNDIIVEGFKVDARVNLSSKKGTRLYIHNNSGILFLCAENYSFGHA